MSTYWSRIAKKQEVVIASLEAEVERLREKVRRCEVGSPHSSHGKDHSHASQIAYLEDRCAKARVTYRCDCGFAMDGPYDPTEWPCAKCKQGLLKPEIVREVERLKSEIELLVAPVEAGGGREAYLRAEVERLTKDAER